MGVCVGGRHIVEHQYCGILSGDFWKETPHSREHEVAQNRIFSLSQVLEVNNLGF